VNNIYNLMVHRCDRQCVDVRVAAWLRDPGSKAVKDEATRRDPTLGLKNLYEELYVRR
jgi:hypothetical protein